MVVALKKDDLPKDAKLSEEKIMKLDKIFQIAMPVLFIVVNVIYWPVFVI